MSGIWDTLGFMISEDTEEIWAVARSARGKDLLGAVKLCVMNPSLAISSSLVPRLHSALHNEPRLQPGGLSSDLQGLLLQRFMHTQCLLPSLGPGEGH